MSELNAALQAQALPEQQLPSYQPHHRAKHQLLRQYMDVWLPKLGFTYDQVVLIDAFASAGRYGERKRGSPLIMLDAFVGRSTEDRARFKNPPHYVFIESKRRFARHLQAEVDAYPDLRGAEVDVVVGKYEDEFPRVIDWLRSNYRRPLPCFAFIDPRGYSDNPFEHIARLKAVLPEKSEVMVYLPTAFMARFAATGKTAAALDKVYGGPTWEEAKDEVSRRRAGDKLADIFYSKLDAIFDWVTRFNVTPERRNDYYLFFGTGHKDGLRAMKRGMWSVDRTAGESFIQAKTVPGQESLFTDDALAAPPDPTPLGELLRAEFGTKVFSIQEAEDFTLCRTKYLDSPHLRQWALRPMEAAGELEVVEAKPGRRKSDYPPGTRMRFRTKP